MLKQTEMTQKLSTVFEPQQATVLSEVITKACIVPLIVTHYARPRVLEKAEEEGIIIVQSFEW